MSANATLIQNRLSKIAVGAKLDAMRSSVVQSVIDNDETIHIWLLSEIKEIEKHRNPTKLNQTLTKLTGTGARVSAIHQFIQTFCNVRMTNSIKQEGADKSERAMLSDGKDHTVFYVVRKARKLLSHFEGRKDGKAKYSDPIKYNPETEAGMEEYLKLAAAKPWWEFKPEPVARPFDFDKVGDTIKNTLTRAFKAVHEKGSFEGTHAELLADLYQLCVKHKINVEEVTNALEGELPKDAPAEISNVIQFKPKVEEVEKPAPAKTAKKRA